MIKKAFNLFILLCFMNGLTLQAQHQWTRTNLGGGGAIALVGATANGRLVAGSDLSGAYTSTDNGASWQVIGAKQGLLQTHISSFGFHPTDGDTFIIGTSLGAYKTTDGGETVYQVDIEFNPARGLGYVESIGMALSNPNIGYMAHHEWWESDMSFLKTIDSGESWNLVQTNGIPTETRIVKILVDANNENLVYALTGKARFGCGLPNLYKSTDGGQNWTEIGNQQGDILDFDLHPTNSNIIYISTFQANTCDNPIWEYVGGDNNTGATYKSTDGGVSFTEIFDKTGIISVGNNPNHISVVDYLFLDTWNSNAGTWKTTNGGQTWTKTGDFTTWDIKWAHPGSAFTPSFNGLNKSLRKNRFNPDNINGSFGQWTWSSFDGGDYFENTSSTQISPNHYLSTGLENINGNSIDVCDSNPNIIYVGAYDVGFYYSKDGGASWKWSIPSYNDYPDYVWWQGQGGNANFVLNDPQRENVVWATFGSDNNSTLGAVFKSTEYGENWQLSNTGLNPMGKNTHGMSIDLNSPVNNRTLYVTQNGDVFKSINDGANWTKILDNGGLKFTAVDKQNSQVVYAGGSNGLFKSTDAGATWNEIGQNENFKFSTNIPNAIMRDDIVPTYGSPSDNSPIVPWQGVFDIQTDPNIPNRIYVSAYGTNKGLYKSDDAGITWTKIYANDYMRGIAISPNNSNIIYASSSDAYHSGGNANHSLGILVSKNAGLTWESANGDMAWPFAGRMEITNETTPKIWAWSPGTGVQNAEIPQPILNTENPTSNQRMADAYPNPVKDILHINPKLITNAQQIIVYSINGQQVKNITIQNNMPNTLHLGHLNTGLYFVVIISDTNKKTIKIIKE